MDDPPMKDMEMALDSMEFHGVPTARLTGRNSSGLDGKINVRTVNTRLDLNSKF